MAVDPMAVDTNSGLNFNRYAYANNSPYRFSDPDGRNAVTALGGLLYETGQFISGNGFDGSMIAGALADGYNGEGDGLASAAVQDLTPFVPTGLVAGAAVKVSRLFFAARAARTVDNGADLFHIAKSAGASGNKIYNRLAELGNQAAGATGRQASSLLQSMAKKAGLEIKAGGKHLKVINPETNKLVTTIPHSPKGSGTIEDIAKSIMKEAGF